MWHELDSKAGFDKALQELPAGKMLLIDYYAPSCAVCKTAFPALCKVRGGLVKPVGGGWAAGVCQ